MDKIMRLRVTKIAICDTSPMSTMAQCIGACALTSISKLHHSVNETVLICAAMLLCESTLQPTFLMASPLRCRLTCYGKNQQFIFFFLRQMVLNVLHISVIEAQMSWNIEQSVMMHKAWMKTPHAILH